MKSAGHTNEIIQDHITMYVINNFAKLDYVVMAVGTGVETNKEAIKWLNMIMAILLDKKANIFQIECPKGR